LITTVCNDDKAPTSETVGAVRASYEKNPQAVQAIFDRITNIGEAVRDYIEGNATDDLDILGSLLYENQELLQTLDVSSEKLDKLVETAMSAGALGAKLSGAGRGGNMIALVTDETQEQVRNALVAAGAAAVYETVLS
ncbi:MAG: mevalonate kinase, partial [Chloroflexota bacterium]